MQTDKLVTKREAAEILGLTISGVNALTANGDIEIAHTVDGPKRAALHLYSRAAIERLARKREADRAAS